jgi:hypothetical protein
MPWRRSSRVLHGLRICPVCGSEAVSTVQRGDVERRRTPLSVRCGECGTWRGSRVRARIADALEEGLNRDVERMAKELVHAVVGARGEGVPTPEDQTGVRHRRGEDRPGG